MVTRRTTLALAALLSSGCGEYAHRNPYDPDTNTRITITGPDTAWSIGEVMLFSATVSPAVTGGIGVFWDTGPDVDPVIAARGGGQFQAIGVGESAVVARVGRHEQAKRVVVRQRPMRVFFFCSGISCTALTMGPAGTTSALTVGQYDALGNALRPGQARAEVTYSSKDPAIVRIAPGSGTPLGVTIQALSSGSTWVRAQLGTWADSVLVTVPSP